jgi:hypothetical protein
METGAIVAVATHRGAAADTVTVAATVIEAGIAVAARKRRRRASMKSSRTECRKWWLTRDTVATTSRATWPNWE